MLVFYGFTDGLPINEDSKIDTCSQIGTFEQPDLHTIPST